MEALLAKIFTESGLVYLLFFMIVAGSIWKGVPFLVKRFDTMNEQFRDSLKQQQATFERTLQRISSDFVSQIEKSNAFHERHSEELREIKDILDKKIK